MIELQVIAVRKEGLATEYRMSPDPVIIGAMDSHYEEKLHLALPEEWEGRHVRVTFTPDMCEGVGFMADSDGCVPITAAFSGAAPRGVITVEAYEVDEADGETVTRKTFARDVRYRAIPHAAPGEPPEDITPTQFEQFVANVADFAADAQSAAQTAQECATAAGASKGAADTAEQNAEKYATSAATSATNAEGYAANALAAQTAAEKAVDGFDEKVTSANETIGEKVTAASGYADTASSGAATAVNAQSLAQQAQSKAEAARDAAAASEFAATNAAGTLANKAAEAAASAEKAEQAAIRAESVTAEPEVFIAEHSVTTYEEIKAAYDAGKIVMCKYYSVTGYLSVVNEGLNYATFSAHDAVDSLYRFSCHAATGWTTVLLKHATEAYVDEKVASLELVSIVTELPETGVENKTYFVAKTDGSGMDLYDEYMWINGAWEYIGTKQIEIDLTEYVKNTDYAHHSKAGLVKTDGNEAYKGVDIVDGVPCLVGAMSPLSDAYFNNPELYKVALLSKDIYRWMKVGLTTNTETLTDEEKTAACEWLGALPKVSTAGTYYDRVYAVDMQGKTQKMLNVSNSYVANTIAQRTESGALFVNTPTADNHATTKAYVDSLVGDVETALDGIMAIQDSLIVGTITFMGEYTALAGMTFGEWVNSRYNTIGAEVTSDNNIYWPADVSTLAVQQTGEHVLATDVISESTEYEWV